MTDKPDKKTRGKGRSKAERLHYLLMKHANKLFSNGRPMVDPATGQVATGADGQPVMVPPTAADFQAACKLLTMRPNPKADRPFDEYGISLEEVADARFELGLLKPDKRRPSGGAA
jgi:hypothetical protein